MLSQIQRFGGAMSRQCCCFPSPGLWWVLPSSCETRCLWGVTDQSEQFIRANRTHY
ncbi:permease IIC component glvC domain protein [Shigella flexneri]